jgi:hypothetical protein
MPSEHVKIHFPTDRLVYVDGKKRATTNKTFRLGEGTHRFDLGPLRNYTPDEFVEDVSGTTAETPLELTFKRKAGA